MGRPPGVRPRSGAGSLAGRARPRALRGVTLVELLVVLALIVVLLSLLLPGLSKARDAAKRVTCAAHLHEIGHGFAMYAGEFGGRSMPLAYTAAAIIGEGPPVYWWGTSDTGGVNHTRGFLWAYLRADLRQSGLYECPSQPWGTYVPQGSAGSITSTYGYNGYYLCPPHTPGYSFSIGHRPWRMLDAIRLPQRVLAFADTAADFGEGQPRNNALLDPPRLYSSHHWMINTTPTTSFRHASRTNGLMVDGHLESSGPRGGRIASARFQIGSIGVDNDPWYVPDWREW